jgi:hypothetical protein
MCCYPAFLYIFRVCSFPYHDAFFPQNVPLQYKALSLSSVAVTAVTATIASAHNPGLVANKSSPLALKNFNA